MQDLGCLPNFGSSEATDMNASGQVVGMLGDWTTNPYTLHAFVDENGPMQDLNDLTTNLDGGLLNRRSDRRFRPDRRLRNAQREYPRFR